MTRTCDGESSAERSTTGVSPRGQRVGCVRLAGTGRGAGSCPGGGPSGQGSSSWLKRNRLGNSAAGPVLDRVFARGDRDDRLRDLVDAIDELDPLARFQQGGELGGERVVLSEQRRVGDLDPIRVVLHRERVGVALVAIQRDDRIGLEDALEREQLADRRVRDGARPLVAEDRDVVDRRDVERGAGRAGGIDSRARRLAVPALEPGHRRVELRGREELDHRQDPAVDQAGLDVTAPAAVDLDVGIGEDAEGQLLL